MIINTIGRALAHLVAFFLPPALRADREAGNQARMFLGSHLIGPVLSTPALMALIFFDPTPGEDIFLTAISLYFFWCLPVFLRLGVPYNFLVVVSLINLHFTILWTCFNYGGITSPIVIWVLVIPILAVFYIGGNRSMRPVLLVASLACFAVFLLAEMLATPVPNDLPESARVGVGLVSTLGTLSYVAAMSMYYARIFDAGVDLENEVQRRRRLAVELRKAVLAANRASASKSEFLARMSHELRTPLNAIIGYAQLLKEDAEDGGDAELVSDVDSILDAGEYLVRLINLILDLSKIDAGRMTLHVRPTDIRAVVETTAAEWRDRIEAGGNTLTLALDAAPADAYTDQTQFRKVIDAILENAAQHTQNGSVTVGSETFVRGERGFFVVWVEDTGCGIGEDQLPSVLETFASTGAAAGGRYGGTGLSLTVANRLCQLMGGKIDVRSEPGRGSVFTVVLPVEGTEATTPPALELRRPATAAAA